MMALWFGMMVAEARDLAVPSQYATIAEAVEEAQAGDVVRVAPGYHFVSDPIVVDKNITIQGQFPPLPVDDPDADLNSWFEPLWEGISGNDGMIRVQGPARLTLRNLAFKGIEGAFYCKDKWDNDGNGLMDGKDPACASFVADSGDTGGPGLPLIGEVSPFYGSTRLVIAVGGATVNFDSSWVQGYSYMAEGAAFKIEDSTLNVSNSVLHNNYAFPALTPSGFIDYGQGGAIHASRSTVSLTDSTLSANVAFFGAALYARQSTVTSDRTVFWINEAHTGGAVYVEDRSELTVLRSHFYGNGANVFVGDDWTITVHQGGAVFVEDSGATINNTVFAENFSLDSSAVALFRQSDAGVIGGLTMQTPDLQFNTFWANTPGVGGNSIEVQNVELVFANNVAAWNFDVLSATDWPAFGAPVVQYNDFFSNDGTPSYNPAFLGVMSGDFLPFPVDVTTNLAEDPQYRQVPADTDHDDYRMFRFWPTFVSPVVDAGDPLQFDVGGTRADMGAYGGPLADVFDNDGDGWVNVYDCDEGDETIYPFATDVCDDKDNNCDGFPDEDETVWYPDTDYDGFGDALATPEYACPGDVLPTLPTGAWVTNNSDCDDSSPRFNPLAPEICDRLDNDCDGQSDEDIEARPHWPDTDGDGFGNGDPSREVVAACLSDPGYSPLANDCNDADPTIHPLVTVDARIHTVLADHPLETSEASRDLAYIADGVDQDCDGGDLCYTDWDLDGYGAAQLSPTDPPQYMVDNDLICGNPSRPTSPEATDCSDRDTFAYPGAPEVVADGVDQNCDGRDNCYEDLDGDGFGSIVVVPDNDLDCANSSGRTSVNSQDCYDVGEDAFDANPGQEEVCDGVDNNCDGTIDEITSPAAKDYYQDADGDGYGNINVTIRACGKPDLYSERAGDCNDGDPRAYPLAPELCDSVDNDCDGLVDDENAIDVEKWYEDVDGDGWGNPDLFELSCNEPEAAGTWVKAGRPLDCDDTDPFIGPCEGCDGCSGSGLTPRAAGLAVAALALALLRRRGARG